MPSLTGVVIEGRAPAIKHIRASQYDWNTTN
ncbi:hypothetical protein ABID25_000586 [Mesorhizobium abyssinicae]